MLRVYVAVSPDRWVTFFSLLRNLFALPQAYFLALPTQWGFLVWFLFILIFFTVEKADTSALRSHSFPGYGRAVKVLWFASWCLLSKSSKLPSSDGEILEVSISGLNFKW